MGRRKANYVRKEEGGCWDVTPRIPPDKHGLPYMTARSVAAAAAAIVCVRKSKMMSITKSVNTGDKQKQSYSIVIDRYFCTYLLITGRV